MQAQFQADVDCINRIEAVPTILDVVCRTTGMRFAAVARVTAERWIACSVLDEIDFGLKPGSELKIETTICHEIRQSGVAVVIDNVDEDADWCKHHTPALYGFKSYISMPIILGDGSFFGTLCAIDPRPARLNTPETVGMFRLFAELIARHIDADRKLATTESALLEERTTGELRDQFIAVLGHDLRTPVRAFSCFTELLLATPLTDEAVKMARMLQHSASRMQLMIDNMLDLARGRQSGLPLERRPGELVEPALQHVIRELTAGQHPGVVQSDFHLSIPVNCDIHRIAQLFSNLLGNALSYGPPDEPIRVRACSTRETFELSVANAGEPIPAAAMKHLFEPFYRNARVHNREGLGLGLYICHEIAVAHSGTLDVESTESETRFTFRMANGI